MNNLRGKVFTIFSGMVIVFLSSSFANGQDISTETDAANTLSSFGIIVNQSSQPEAYKLQDPITRREMLKVMMNVSLVKGGDNCTGKFIDVTASDWGCKYAENALSKGFIAQNLLFKPNDNISKIEALKMMLQARGISKDLSFSDWRAGYVNTAVEKGILSASFTDYDTKALRGWIFSIGVNAISVTPNLKVSCIDEVEGTPIIISLSTNSGTVGSQITIKGCNFSGFEGDKNVWVENKETIKGIIHGGALSTSNSINITLNSQLCQTDTSYSGLPCDSWLTLVPGNYKIYVNPWGKVSNKVDFIIKDSDKIGLTEKEAKKIAEETCIKGGETLSGGTYNENSQTWWFDANLNAVITGCHPSCVVSEITKTADINRRCTGLIIPEISYQDVMNYVDQNITELMTNYSSIEPANAKWFADGYGFTSHTDVYVDYEDGHNLYRTLLHCNEIDNALLCNPVAIFEKQNDTWIIIKGEDTQKDNPIVYQYAKDYQWER